MPDAPDGGTPARPTATTPATPGATAPAASKATRPAPPSAATRAAPPSAGTPAFDPHLYREVLARFVTGVTVVTTLDERSDPPQPFGTTVNAFSAVSFEPPLVLVCIGRERSIRPVIGATGRFAVNILPEGSQDLSDCFAGAPSELPRSAFCGAAYHRGTLGVPVLDASIAHLECRLEQELETGDHVVFIGRVEGLETHDVHGLPLLYYRRRYLRIERAATAELLGKPEL
ncbi:MAG TPA: flavin reductase family protein [Candidatus Limnocylindrales bacterium]|nr:flavin reductase family protein [Candidatus Limnocylindrales bacterium]